MDWGWLRKRCWRESPPGKSSSGCSSKCRFPARPVSLRRNALLLVVLTVVIAVVGDWNRGGFMSGAWCFPVALIFIGLAYESWLLSRGFLTLKLQLPPRCYLGRTMLARFVFSHALRRPLRLEIAA